MEREREGRGTASASWRLERASIDSGRSAAAVNYQKSGKIMPHITTYVLRFYTVDVGY